MSTKMRIELNSEGIREMLHSPEITDAISEVAQGIASRAGDGYETDVYNAGTRNVASVYTATKEAYEDNLRNNTLLTAMGGGSE